MSIERPVTAPGAAGLVHAADHLQSRHHHQTPLKSHARVGEKASSEPGVILPGIGFVAYKHVALLMLVAQTVGAILALRVSRTVGASSVKYLNTTAVFISEVIKLLGSFALVVYELNGRLFTAIQQVHSEIICKPGETLKVGVPALLYALQNNLLFIALSNMSPATYQVTYQLKILSTAVLSVLILKKWLSIDKWASLIMLTAGVALIQVPASEGPQSANEALMQGNPVLGTVAVLSACMTSGFAGVYFEKILKGSKTSIWMRNIQLAVLGGLVSLLGALWVDGSAIKEGGFFQGYNSMTWVAIMTQSAGGLIVAAVLKFADNILKCFGNALAIVLSCLISYLYLQDYQPTIFFVIGTALVIAATYTYGIGVRVVTALMPKQHEETEMTNPKVIEV
eukprot:Blabericola_migrator_1__3661@NODE_2098_length_3279_cov_78_729763_g1329_i0_p1_GENE_NODE_2098_length_3279_cov_78_729763_g1329_i0NODE_2098_length_3279_cov_78_729763_g1329_i0_p1_ORF_typecomplete_len396_score56_05Nuc_sug_transp/PF04142_15/8_2e101CRTlike/PF08627_10/1_4e17CRTlike/PF08627_10/98TPT/PF03151_16/6_4e11UAA/PF08449_11/6_5e02UAA/PF08449_11/1_7e10SLC35F/PF06027_12/5_5e10PUNUT/PF16913_5/9_6e06PUNUT/PF16913_5/1_1e03EamA/PF00892_20/8_5e02EamA/PF00892_20/3_8e05EamA/PF00892_20/7_2TMEM234/PF10639_9/2